MHNPISWHIEPTSRCTLECPGCDRTWYKKTFKHQIIQDIDIQALHKFFSSNNFTASKITLCGNNGDPIYHPEFENLVSMLKSQKHKLSIHTNGSAKTSKFWHSVCSKLDKNDRIVFAVDGLQDTNHLYRKNSNWHQIMEAIQIATSYDFRTEWQFIVFATNQHQIEEAKNLSKKLKMDHFRLVKSDRWIDESLHEFMPTDQYINEKYALKKNTVNNNTTKKQMSPKCLTNQDIFIDSQGNIFPCCYSATYRFRQKNPFGKTLMNIDQISYKLDTEKNNFLHDSQQWSSASLVCRLHCGK